MIEVIKSGKEFKKYCNSFFIYNHPFIRIKNSAVLVMLYDYWRLDVFDLNKKPIKEYSENLNRYFAGREINDQTFQDIFEYIQMCFPLSDDEEQILEIIK